MDAPQTSMTQHLEGFLHSARKLEEALQEEKRKHQKLAQEYISARTTLENALRELQNRLLQRENKIQALSDAFRNLQESEARLKQDLRDISEREKKNRTELSQYQSAWNEVLARESQARGVLIEHEKAKRILSEMRAQIQSLETALREANQSSSAHASHAETYQRELQSALIRIQSAESKYNQIQKELSVVSQNKKNADEEIAKIEENIKERFRWELATERERLRAELEKDAALDRERFREVSRNQLRAEIERSIIQERQAKDSALQEAAALRERLREAEEGRARDSAENQKLKIDIEAVLEKKANQEATLIDRAEKAEKTMASMEREAAILRMEITNIQTKMEASKRDSSKALFKEHLKHEAQITELKRNIERLLMNGIYVEKIDAAPDAAKIQLATSVENAEYVHENEARTYS